MDVSSVFNPAFQQNLLTEIRHCMALAETLQAKIKDPNFIRTKADSSPVTEADHAVQDRLGAFLKEQMPEWPFIGEENAAEWLAGDQVLDTPFWLCDPIDGTQDYATGGKEYAINLALVKNGIPVFGLIAAPGRGDIAWMDASNSVLLQDQDGNTRAVTVASLTRTLPEATLIVGHGRRKDVLAFEEIIQKPPVAVIHCASALKFHALLKGEAQVYLRIRETSEWDIAAGDAMIRALGGQVFEMDRQTPITYGRPERNLKLTSVFITLGAA